MDISLRVFDSHCIMPIYGHLGLVLFFYFMHAVPWNVVMKLLLTLSRAGDQFGATVWILRHSASEVLQLK